MRAHTVRSLIVFLQTRLMLAFYTLTGKKLSLEIRGEGQFDGTCFDGISDEEHERTLHWQCGMAGLLEMQGLARQLIGDDFLARVATFPDSVLNTSNRVFDEADARTRLTAFQPRLVLLYNSHDRLVLFGTIAEGTLTWVTAPHSAIVREHLLQQQRDLREAALQARQTGQVDRFDTVARLYRQMEDIDFLIAVT
ncbi:hypothetical protein RDT67_28745 [Serratia fonticola]|uniref:Uncharacterized protein n=1 Tax=Serratia fonticola TaxID=47917 RepID=A0AAJ1YHR3_SERFO|nr:hypothetical protein [Serratia fonticola]MDQ9130392.1 hypothetical protein [Serratia fonticola]